jgi:Uma2 family endonuclease
MGAYPVPAGERPLSIEEFERLPDDEYRSELVRGRLIREPPVGAEHGGVTMELGARLSIFARGHHLGRVLAETGFILAEDPPTVRAPDIAFVAAARIPPDGLPRPFPLRSMRPLRFKKVPSHPCAPG